MALSNEENVANALDALSPSEVQDSQRLLTSFRAFFARGSARDFYRLLPNQDKIFSEQSGRDYISAGPQNSRETQNSNHPQGRHRKSRKPNASGFKEKPPSVVSYHTNSVGDNSFNVEIQEARGFFAANVSSQAQSHRLMRVLEGAWKAPRQSAEFYLGLWSAHRSRVFDTNGAVQSRIARLFRGRKLIEQESQRFEYASRLSLVFLTHDVETIKAQNWKLAPGQSRQNAAVISIASHLNVEPEEIKKEWRRSRNYIRLLEECGPASLLELGTGVNWYWEKALNKQDVTLFIQFYKERKPSFASHASELNAVAGKIIIDGMLAYGWTLEAICTANTRLCKALAIHCPNLLPSPVININSPRSASLESEGPSLFGEPFLDDTPAFISTETLGHAESGSLHGVKDSSEWDLYLAHVGSNHFLPDDARLQSFLDGLEVGKTGDWDMEPAGLAQTVGEDRM